MRKTLLISLLCIFTIQVFSQSINEDYKALPEEFIQNSQDRYGSTVAIDGNYAVVGATMYKNFQGCAYVLFKNGETWEKVATLTASDAATNVILGYSVSISGENIVAGSSNDAAYVFTKPVSGWVDMTETAKLTVTDITPNRFGQYVSISGDNIVVTDYYDDDNGNSSGSAYVYTKPSGGWVNMTETAELTASDGAEYDYFGGRVSISGDNIVIGSHGEDDNGSNSGSVYVFTKPVGGWTTMTETAKLLASDGAADHHFGQSVYISGDIIIAGEDVDYQGGETGAVYVYTKPISGWENMTENAQLTASDGALVDRYGYSLCISGDDIVVGAFSDDDNGNNSGSAYVFSKPLSGWINMTETAKLTASDGAANDNFGWVSIDGENIIIGATGDDDNGGSSGAVYTYVKPISGWVNDTESQKIIADPYFSSTESVYGISVSIDGDYAIVGSYGYMSNQGCAYILHYTGTIWENIARLTASDGASYDYFGYSVSISGDHIVVGAYRDDDNGDNSGSAYIFTKPANGWVDMTQTAKITASDGDSGDEFGRSARISGNNIVIGAYRDDDNGNGSGSAYIFTKPSGGWEDMIQTAKLTASDGAYSDCFGYSTSISGDYIVIGALYSNNDGAAYVFTKPSGGWIDMTETAKLIASDNVGGNQDHLGYSVGISGDNIIAGAYWITKMEIIVVQLMCLQNLLKAGQI